MVITMSGLKHRFKLEMPKPQETPNLNLDDKCKIKLTNDSEEIEIAAKDLEVLEELGKGGYGVVEKMRHRQSGIIMAVKRISSSINDESQKRMLTELDACKRSDCCPQMVRFYGAMFREGDVWICMEVMDTSLDKFYKKCNALGRKLPEPFIAKVTLSVVEGLNFMKEDMNLIHRDVKPSNILLNRHGQVKICDFGISGHLTNSLAKTVAAGCKFYMPPERIDGDMKGSYDVRADVWSLGITLVEIATGTYPYDIWVTPFQQLKQVIEEPAPRLPSDGSFSADCQYFVQRCLEKNPHERPKYPELLAMPFLDSARNEKQFSMAKYIVEILDASAPSQSSTSKH
ncbi:Dual specificity mitogen-activated protein kinase kinase sek-1 [Parelaphostrongylus tenuis]|uniref:mitogen-activated protein kinase kinase n=1 Tax=Parelaphostrongylus tenuis TaxID=148309 RepID=A0AAD5M101_PARTN|nr:Dual specificity mitogen-activated protein kinase kinase sek-1 [Parelaphostrongylus tenuis]